MNWAFDLYYIFDFAAGLAILITGGWGYDQDVLRTSVVNPFEISSDCNTNEIIELSSDKNLGSFWIV